MPDSGFCKDCKHVATAHPINGGVFLGCGMSSYLINFEVALKVVEPYDTCTDYAPNTASTGQVTPVPSNQVETSENLVPSK
jgi:hypothetical protein